MSKLEELIQQYCPDGVEWSTIGDVCQKVFAGGTPTSSNSSYYGGDIPWLRSGEVNFNEITSTEKTITEEGYNSSSARWVESQSVLVAMTGATVARSAITLIELTANQSVCALTPKRDILNYRYLFYWISKSYIQMKGMAQGALTSLNLNLIKSLEIPIPPLPVQEEIVRVLDTFTELQAELQAELQKRLQQYNYYRDNLLSFKGRADVEWKKLGEISKVCRGVRVVKSQLSNEGYPVYQNCLTPMGYYDKTNCPAGTPFVICGGAAGNVGYADVDWWAADDCEYIIGNEGLTNRYIYHCLMAKKDYLLSQVRKASIPRLSPSVIKDLEIPVPSLAEQQRIVDILDMFDSLTTDLTAGLPAEIEKRKLQYEYYRDKLLTFKRK